MSQTAPPNRNADPDDTGRSGMEHAPDDPRPTSDDDSTRQPRDWKHAVAAVGSTAVGAARDSVSVVGDAARSLTGRQQDPTKPDGGTEATKRRLDTGRWSTGRIAARLRKDRESTDQGNGAPGGPPATTRPRDHEPARARHQAPGDDGTAAGDGHTAAAGNRSGTARASVDARHDRVPPAPPRRDGAVVDRETAWLTPLRERRHNSRPWLLRAGTFALVTLAGMAALFVAAIALVPRAVAYAAESADAELILPDDTEFGILAQRTRVYGDDGKTLLAILHGDEDRNPVSLAKMPDHAWQAIVATEDKKFFDHDGYDLAGIGRAAVANVQAGGVEQGGSTITQQVARMNFSEVGTARSLDRKFKEVIYARAIEERFTKQQILDRYVNQVYFGSGSYGMQAASEEYFDTNVVEIEPDQAALLAGLISAPNTYNPRTNPEAAKSQRNLVLDSMADVGYLSGPQTAALKRKPLEIAPRSTSTNKEPSIIEAVIAEFKRNPIFGATRQEREEFLFTGGLRITTTINSRLQRAAEDIIERDFEVNDDSPTAVIGSVDPRTGAIKAAASAEEYNQDNFNLALLGRKQPGSAAKPLVMAAALQQGFSPATTLDAPGEKTFPIAGTEPWTVGNFGDASYGRIDMGTATQKSVNTYYAQLIQLVGMDQSVEMMERFGIDIDAALGDPSQRGFSIVLGGWTHGATTIEMSNAYASFANNGVRHEPYLLTHVKQGKDELLGRRSKKTQVLEPGVNAAALEIMKRPVGPGGTTTYGTLPGWQTIGKTGTNQNARSVWFVGATAKLSTAVWVGYPDNDLRSLQGGAATGGGLAAPIWNEYMNEAFLGTEPLDFPEAEEAEFVGKEVNVPAVTGLSEADALAKLAKAKLIGTPQYQSSGAPEGVVIWASPSDTANVGTTIYIGVSTGAPPPEPDLEPEPEPDDPEPQQPDDSGGNDTDDGGGNNDGGNDSAADDDRARQQAEDIAERVRDQIRDSIDDPAG